MPDSVFQKRGARLGARLRAWGPAIFGALRDAVCYPVGEYGAPTAEAQRTDAARTNDRFDHVGRNLHWHPLQPSWEKSRTPYPEDI